MDFFADFTPMFYLYTWRPWWLVGRVIRHNFKGNPLRMIQAKFGLNWPSGFRGEGFWKSLDGRRMPSDGNSSHRWAKNTRESDMLISTYKCYKSIAACCCTLWLSDISVSNWFMIYFKSEFRMQTKGIFDLIYCV